MIERRQLGGTDGFRGEATIERGPGRMNWETLAGLTYALVMEGTDGEGGGRIAIGRDTRSSGQYLQSAAIAGATFAGAEVYWLDIAPTPTVLRTAAELELDAAVVITASHNKDKDNGWKGTKGGNKPYGDQVTAIDNRYWDQVESGLVIPSVGNRATRLRTELVIDYENDLVQSVENIFGQRPLEGKWIVVDAANGAAMGVAPRVMKQLGANVVEYACDGSKLINDGCGATDLGGVQQFMREHPSLARLPGFLGVLAYDGDADRFIGMGVDTDGEEMNFHELEGNRVMELLAPGQPGVVGTEYTNSASIERLKADGIDFGMCPNGDVEVTRMLRKLGWNRGSEFTGHHVDLSWLSSGDGVRTGAMIAALAASNGTNFAEMSKNLPLWPEKMRNLKVRSGMGASALASVLDLLVVSDQDAAAGLRLVVRESGTEKDSMRVWASGQDGKRVDEVTQQIVDGMMEYAV